MMTKSKPDEASKTSDNTTASDSNNRSNNSSSSVVHKKLDAVADLERRLADLTVPETPAAAAPAPAFAMPPPAATSTSTSTAASGSKNALLVSVLFVKCLMFNVFLNV